MQQWSLPTADGEYVVSVLPDGSGVVLDHWGARLPDGIDPWREPTRFVQYAMDADVAPLELASAGHRHSGFSELRIDRGDSLVGATWQVLDDTDAAPVFSRRDGKYTLTVPFTDETGDLRLTLITETSDHDDVVRRSMRVDNFSSRVIRLERAFSAGWALPTGQRATVHYLAGAWSQEFQPRTVDLNLGTFSIGSRQGVTGLAFSPVVTVESSLLGREAEAYGIALEWSGSWRMQVESTIVGDRIRVSAGVDDDTTVITLLPGEGFTSPTSVGVWSRHGVEGVTQAWNAYQRTSLARSLDPAHRPIVYNSWFATEFDVRVDHQLDLARVAAEVGVEVFVVDDGWFVGRNNDRAGLGDWEVDPAKFPLGLGALADAVTAQGMRFGLWIEPEAVNPDSDLYRAHPDWVYRAGTRPLVFGRNQLVLDLGRPEVVEWIEETLRRLLTSATITYLKWDMNRPVSDGGRPGDVHGRAWSLQHTHGYYRVLRMLRTEFPWVTIEACAAGGGRIDNAVLKLCDVVWPSDETGPRDRLAIQHGFLSAYPAYAMSSWVSDDRGLRDRSEVSFEFRFVVAMAGVLGIGANILEWTPEQRTRARQLTSLFRDVRNTIHTGTATRYATPATPGYFIEYVDSSGAACILVYDRDRDRRYDREQQRVRPQNLEPQTRYRLRGTATEFSGAEAAALGIVVPFALANDADVLVLDPIR